MLFRSLVDRILLAESFKMVYPYSELIPEVNSIYEIYFNAYLYGDSLKPNFDTETNKIDEDVRKYLLGQGVEVSGYEDVRSYTPSIPNESTILLDKSSLNSWVFNSIPKSCKTINEMNPSFKLKSRKSEIELRNQKNAYIKDGVAVTKFL